MRDFIIALLTCSVTMSALALLYMATTPLLAKHYSAKGRYYAWLIIVAGLIIPYRPQFHNAFIQVNIPREVATPIVHTGSGIPGAATVFMPTPDALIPSAPSAISWWQLAAVIWLAGMVTSLAYHAVKHYCFLKMTGRWNEDITDEQTLMLFQNLKLEMGISKRINVYLCASVGSPVMIGFLNPRILLPKTNLSTDDIRFILKHELIHYIRKDLWYKALVLVAAAIHWFNPIVYLMTRAIEIQCELSCDSETLGSADADARFHYTEAIIGVIKCSSKRKTALSTNFYGGKKGMKNRISSIMDTTKKKTGGIFICAVMILTMATSMAFAANTSEANIEQLDRQANTQTVTESDYSMMSRFEPTTGMTYYSWDLGKTWTPLTNAEYDAMFPSPVIEWWTYDEYKVWMEEQIAELQALADDGVPDYYDKTGTLRGFTQKDVDQAAATYQTVLDEIANGFKVSKTVDGSDEAVISYNPADITTVAESASAYSTGIRSDADLAQYEADNAEKFEKYMPFGLVYRDGELFYNGEAVRCFDDWYSLGENMQAGLSYYGDGGTVDVRAVRDFSQIVYNPDGSHDPSGILLGVEACSQDEFNTRDLSEYASETASPIEEVQSIEDSIRPYERFGVSYDEKAGMMMYQGLPVREIFDEVAGILVSLSGGTGFPDGDIPEDAIDLMVVYKGSVMTGLRKSTKGEFDLRTRQRLDAIAEAMSVEALQEATTYIVEDTSTSSASSSSSDATGKTIAEIFDDYAAFGVTFDTNSINGGLGNIYYKGKLVRRFADVQPNGGTISCTSSDGGEIDVRTLYDETGKLIGVEVTDN